MSPCLRQNTLKIIWIPIQLEASDQKCAPIYTNKVISLSHMKKLKLKIFTKNS